jgi:hypothetical protein
MSISWSVNREQTIWTCGRMATLQPTNFHSSSSMGTANHRFSWKRVAELEKIDYLESGDGLEREDDGRMVKTKACLHPEIGENGNR